MFDMRVVHLAITPLAGAPMRICEALRRHADVEARFIVKRADAYGSRTFPTDLIWDRDRVEARRLIDNAGLLVLHNQVGPEGHYFAEDLDLSEYERAGKPMVRQFHSPAPFLVEHGPWRSEHDLMSDHRLPQLVIAQAQERMYPNAAPVPNVVPLDVPLFRRRERCDASSIRIVFSPTSRLPANADRWSTKGRDETIEVLQRVEERYRGRVVIDVIEDTPYAEAQRRRQRADLAIDEVVTGNVHLSSFESLALGIATISHVDDRLDAFLRGFTGAATLPWVNATLASLETTLVNLIESDADRRAIGDSSSRWMRAHWNDAWAARVHRDRYEAVLRGEDPGRGRLDLSNFDTWWNVYGRVESRRLDTMPELVPETERRRLNAIGASAVHALRTCASVEDSITIVADHEGTTSDALREWGGEVHVHRLTGAAIPPSVPPAEVMVTHETLIHRDPVQAHELVRRMRKGARRRVLLIERRCARPINAYHLDARGGAWNHDWPALLGHFEDLTPEGMDDLFIAAVEPID